MGGLDGKVAVVTGAGSGIGEASARLMARGGASVVVADISRTEAERVAGVVLLTKAGGAIRGAYIDATTLMVDGGATVYMPSPRSAGGE